MHPRCGHTAECDKVEAKHGKSHSEIADIRRLFAEVAREMIMHMQKEEQILFPYIDALEKATNSHGSVEPPPSSKRFGIRSTP